MDPISQGSLGAALAQSGSNPEKIKAATLLGCFAGLAPDLDISSSFTVNSATHLCLSQSAPCWLRS